MCVKSFTTDREPPTYRYPIFIQYKPSQPIGDHPLWPCTLRCHQTWLAMGNPLWYYIVGKSSRNGGFNDFNGTNHRTKWVMFQQAVFDKCIDFRLVIYSNYSHKLLVVWPDLQLNILVDQRFSCWTTWELTSIYHKQHKPQKQPSYPKQ